MQKDNGKGRRAYIDSTLRRLIVDYIDPESKTEQLVPDVPLLEQGLDSFDFMRLLIDIEDIFEVELGVEDLLVRRMDTLADLIEVIESLPTKK